MKQLLCLHGALGSEKSFEPHLDALSAAFEVHRMDFPGHGAHAGKYFTMDDLVSSTCERLQQIDDQVYILGYSMGGYVALTVAEQLEEKIAGVVTIGTKFEWSPEIAERETAFLNPEVILNKVPHYAQELIDLHGEEWRMNLKTTANFMRQLGSYPHCGETSWKAIKRPVRILRAAHDAMVSEGESRAISECIPNAQFVEIEGKHPLKTLQTATILTHLNELSSKE